jgi:hypothetical protein
MAAVLAVLMVSIYYVCLEMPACGIMYVACSVKIVTVVQAIFRLSNLRDCNVGISDGLVKCVVWISLPPLHTHRASR